jgi:hypothetical protein
MFPRLALVSRSVLAAVIMTQRRWCFEHCGQRLASR